MSNHKKINELSIISYRKLKNVNLTDLKTINVFSGINNSGKTSVLEVIGLMSDIESRYNFQKWALIRSPWSNGYKKNIVDYMSGVFPNSDDKLGDISVDIFINKLKHSVIIKGEKENVVSSIGKISKSLKVSVNDFKSEKPKIFKFKDGGRENFKIENTHLFDLAYVMVEEDFYAKSVTYFSNALHAQQKEELMKLMHDFDKNIEDIFLDETGDIYIQNAVSGVLPLFAYGSGMQKAFLLATILSNDGLDVIMVDEIDSALNITALKDVLTWFVNSCRKHEVQAFITTHNAEAIDAILDNVDNDNDDIRIITMRNQNNAGNTVVKSLNGIEARQYRTDYEMELRI